MKRTINDIQKPFDQIRGGIEQMEEGPLVPPNDGDDAGESGAATLVVASTRASAPTSPPVKVSQVAPMADRR